MNKLILELAKRAWPYGQMMTDDIDRHNARCEKFAELIVQECVSLIRKQSIGEEILGGQRYKTVQLGETIATITEHFGVE